MLKRSRRSKVQWETFSVNISWFHQDLRPASWLRDQYLYIGVNFFLVFSVLLNIYTYNHWQFTGDMCIHTYIYVFLVIDRIDFKPHRCPTSAPLSKLLPIYLCFFISEDDDITNNISQGGVEVLHNFCTCKNSKTYMFRLGFEIFYTFFVFSQHPACYISHQERTKMCCLLLKWL